MQRHYTLILFIVFLLFSCGQSSNKNKPKNPKIVLQKAAEALNKAVNVSYNYTYSGDGKLNGKFSGAVRLVQKDKYQDSWIWTNLIFHENDPKSASDITKEWIISIKDGELKLFDKSTDKLQVETLKGGSMNLMTYAYYSVLFQYIQKTPFENELKNETLEYVRVDEINGTMCDVIKLKSTYGDWVTWYIGQEDSLIHGQITENLDEKTGGSFTFRVNNLAINTEFAANDFDIVTTASTTIVEEDRKAIAVKSQAPGWQIEDRNGSLITSNQLRGKVVLLDFWASWCNPCWQIMPVVDQVAKEFPDLFVLGINVWENPNRDPFSYMRNENLNYQTVVDKDATLAMNFKVAYLPVLVLIDKEGVIRHVSNGYTDSLERDLREAIEKYL